MKQIIARMIVGAFLLVVLYAIVNCFVYATSFAVFLTAVVLGLAALAWALVTVVDDFTQNCEDEQ